MGFPTIDLMRTGANIMRLRKAAGLTVHDLQMVFGFNSPQAIYKWQNGAALPTVDNLASMIQGRSYRQMLCQSNSYSFQSNSSAYLDMGMLR